jgi:hypothetical protein
MLEVLVEDGGQVTASGDQESVGALPACTTCPALRKGVRPRRLRRTFHDLDAGVGQDRVERRGELGVTVADEEPERSADVVQVGDEVAGGLGYPGPGGVTGHAEDPDPAGSDLDGRRTRTPAARRRCRQ